MFPTMKQLEQSDFLFTTFGDGGVSILCKWNDLEALYTDYVSGDDPDVLEGFYASINDTEEWSNNHISSWHQSFEDGSVSIIEVQPQWQPIKTAPTDGRTLLLIVKAEENGTDDEIYSRTIGFNNKNNDGVDKWLFAGWCWTSDLFSHGQGEALLWMEYPSKPETHAE